MHAAVNARRRKRELSTEQAATEIQRHARGYIARKEIAHAILEEQISGSRGHSENGEPHRRSSRGPKRPPLERDKHKSTAAQLVRAATIIVSGEGEYPEGTDVDGLVLTRAYAPRALGFLSMHNPIRRAAIRLTQHRAFETIVMTTIIANCVSMALWRPDYGGSALEGVLAVAEDVFLYAFSIEAGLKITSLGFAGSEHAYLHDRWNGLDFIVVASSWITFGADRLLSADGALGTVVVGRGVVAQFRAARVLRAVRSFTLFPALRKDVECLLKSMHGVIRGYAVLLVFFLAFFSVLGLYLFGGALRHRCALLPSAADGPPYEWTYDDGVACSTDARAADVGVPWLAGRACPEGSVCVESPSSPNYGLTSFDHIGVSMLTLFQCMTGEDWTGVMYLVMDATSPLYLLYFLTFMFVGYFIVLNLLLAVIDDVYHQLSEAYDARLEASAGAAESLPPSPEPYRPRAATVPAEAPQPPPPQLQPSASSVTFPEPSPPGGRAGVPAEPSARARAPSPPPAVRSSSRRGSAAQAIGLDVTPPPRAQRAQPARGALERRSKGKSTHVLARDAWYLLRRRLIRLGKRIDGAAGRLPGAARAQAACTHIAESRFFAYSIFLLILANTVTMSTERPYMAAATARNLGYVNLIYIVCFALEMGVKLVALGVTKYCTDSLNVFDALVVILSLLEYVLATAARSVTAFGAIRSLRTFRLLRVFKLARSWSSFRELLITVRRSIAAVRNFLLLLFLFIFIFALWGLHAFGGAFDLPSWDGGEKPRAHFDGFFVAFVTVFQVLTTENWPGVMYTIFRATGDGASVVYFIVVLVLGNWMVLTLFLARLLSNFPTASTSSFQQELQLMQLPTTAERATGGGGDVGGGGDGDGTPRVLPAGGAGLVGGGGAGAERASGASASGGSPDDDLLKLFAADLQRLGAFVRRLASRSRALSTAASTAARLSREAKRAASCNTMRASGADSAGGVSDAESGKPRPSSGGGGSGGGSGGAGGGAGGAGGGSGGAGSGAGGGAGGAGGASADAHGGGGSAHNGCRSPARQPAMPVVVRKSSGVRTRDTVALDGTTSTDGGGIGGGARDSSSDDDSDEGGAEGRQSMPASVLIEMSAPQVSALSGGLLAEREGGADGAVAAAAAGGAGAHGACEGPASCGGSCAAGAAGAAGVAPPPGTGCLEVAMPGASAAGSAPASPGAASSRSARSSRSMSRWAGVQRQLRRSRRSDSPPATPGAREQRVTQWVLHARLKRLSLHKRLTMAGKEAEVGRMYAEQLTLWRAGAVTPHPRPHGLDPEFEKGSSRCGSTLGDAFHLVALEAARASKQSDAAPSCAAGGGTGGRGGAAGSGPSSPAACAHARASSPMRLTSMGGSFGGQPSGGAADSASAVSGAARHTSSGEQIGLPCRPPPVLAGSSLECARAGAPAPAVPPSPRSARGGMGRFARSASWRDMSAGAAGAVASHVKTMAQALGFDGVDASALKGLQGRSFFVLAPDHPLRSRLYALVRHSWFESIVLVLILGSCVALVVDERVALARDRAADSEAEASLEGWEPVVHVLNIAFACLFGLEMLIRMVVQGVLLGAPADEDTVGPYLQDPWNQLDALIVVVSVVSLFPAASQFSTLRLFRTLRAFRPLRLVHRLPGLRIVVNALLRSIPKVCTMLFLYVFFLLIVGILGVNQFGGKFTRCVDAEGSLVPVDAMLARRELNPLIPPDDWMALCLHGAPLGWTWEVPTPNFDSVALAMLMLFEVSTFEGWPDMMYSAMDAPSVVGAQAMREAHVERALFFVFAVIIFAFFLTNLFVGVVIDNFNQLKAEMEGKAVMTESQLEWVEAQRLIFRHRPKIKVHEPINRIRRACFRLVYSETTYVAARRPLGPRSRAADDPAPPEPSGRRSSVVDAVRCSAARVASPSARQSRASGTVAPAPADGGGGGGGGGGGTGDGGGAAAVAAADGANGAAAAVAVAADDEGRARNRRGSRGKRTAVVAPAPPGASSAPSTPPPLQIRVTQTPPPGATPPGSPPLLALRGVATDAANRVGLHLDVRSSRLSLESSVSYTTERARQLLERGYYGQYFDLFIMTCVLLNIAVMMTQFHGQPSAKDAAHMWINMGFGLIYAVEAALKITAYTFGRYIADGWNAFDFFLVLVSVLTTASLLYALGATGDVTGSSVVVGAFPPSIFRILRIFRVMRVLKLVRSLKQLRMLMQTLWLSFPALANIGVILVLLVFIFSVLGMSLFGRVRLPGDFTGGLDEHANFGTFAQSVLTHVRMMFGEAWNAIMWDCVDKGYNNGAPDGVTIAFFVSYQFVMGFVCLNLAVAVILDFFDEAGREDERVLKASDVELFARCWAEYDPHARHTIRTEQLGLLLRDVPPPLGCPWSGVAEKDEATIRECLAVSAIPDFGGRVHYVDVITRLALFNTFLERLHAEYVLLLSQKEQRLPNAKVMAKLQGEFEMRYDRVFKSIRELPTQTGTTADMIDSIIEYMRAHLDRPPSPTPHGSPAPTALNGALEEAARGELREAYAANSLAPRAAATADGGSAPVPAGADPGRRGGVAGDAAADAHGGMSPAAESGASDKARSAPGRAHEGATSAAGDTDGGGTHAIVNNGLGGAGAQSPPH